MVGIRRKQILSRLIFLALVLGLPRPALAQDALCSARFAEVGPSPAVLRNTIAENNFTVTRTWANFEYTFGPEFKKDVYSLGAKERWLNSGAGAAGPEMTFLRESPNGEVISLALKKPDTFIDHHFPEAPRFRYLEGSLLEDIPEAELGKFKVITDFYGPIAYTKDFSGVLQKYLNLLEPDGVIYFTLERASNRTQLVHSGNDELMLSSWIESMPGLKVEAHRAGTEDVFRISKLSKEPVLIPHLRLENYEYSTPPSRVYRTE